MFENELGINFGFARVTPQGVLFNGKQYSNSKMIRNKWFEQANSNGDWYVPVYFYPSMINTIIILQDFKQEFVNLIEASNTPSIDELEKYYCQIETLKIAFQMKIKNYRDRN